MYRMFLYIRCIERLCPCYCILIINSESDGQRQAVAVFCLCRMNELKLNRRVFVDDYYDAKFTHSYKLK